MALLPPMSSPNSLMLGYRAILVLDYIIYSIFTYCLCAPPSFSDLGKQARDLFSKNFVTGQWKLEAKTRSESGCVFKATTVNNTDNGVTLSTVENEFAWPDYGLKFLEKWNTDNCLCTEVTIEDQLVKGLKTTFDSSFNPSSGKKKGIIKNSFKQDYINAGLDLDFASTGLLVKAASVVGYEGWLAGFQAGFDTSTGKVTSNNVSLGYDGKDYVITAFCRDLRDFEGSYYHRVNSEWELSTGGSWSVESNQTCANMAAKYSLSDDTNVKAKANAAGELTFSLQQKVCQGVSLTLSSWINAKNFHAGAHKIGFALEVDQ